MSKRLEEIISEQQKEIAGLLLVERSAIAARQREIAQVDALAVRVFCVLNHPQSQECRHELKRAIEDMGFCSDCGLRPCECDIRALPDSEALPPPQNLGQ